MATTVRPRRAIRVGFLLALALLASFGAVMTTPRPVVACSCVGFQSLKEAATPDNAVFTGTAGLRQARGVPVEVERWFWGRGSAPIVWLSGASFGDGNSCGIDPPPAGSSWLWVGWPADDGTLGTGLCSPAARLDSPEGQKMLTEAIAVFGAVNPVPPDPTATPTSEAALPTPVAGPAEIARDQSAVTILGLLLLGSVALFGGVLLFARRSSRGERP